MFVYVMKTAAVFLTAIWVAAIGGLLSSDCPATNLSRFCAESHGQKVAHDCLGSVFTESEKPSPTTGYSDLTL